MHFTMIQSKNFSSQGNNDRNALVKKDKKITQKIVFGIKNSYYSQS